MQQRQHRMSASTRWPAAEGPTEQSLGLWQGLQSTEHLLWGRRGTEAVEMRRVSQMILFVEERQLQASARRYQIEQEQMMHCFHALASSAELARFQQRLLPDDQQLHLHRQLQCAPAALS